MNRELSWLKFNERVLEEAERKDDPLCERLNFTSIYGSNLDEFFMVHIGSLIDRNAVDKKWRDNKTEMTAEQQLKAVLKTVHKLNERKEAIYTGLMEEISDQGINIIDPESIPEDEKTRLEQYFENEIAPLVSPFIIGKRQPFPFLRNKEIYAVAVLESEKKGKKKLGVISCCKGAFPRLIPVSSGNGSYILAEELVLHFISKIFKEYNVLEKTLIRVTRNADIDADSLYDEEIDYREFMSEVIKKRKKLAPVRLEYTRVIENDTLAAICAQLSVFSNSYVFKSNIPLDLSFLFNVSDLLRKNESLFYTKRFPQRLMQFENDLPILPQIKAKDKLLSYPYDSIKPFISMLREAANDKDVVSIKMTLYRVAKQSEVVEALIEAAENGKDVLVLVELKARFDEENNIEWSRRLEKAGCSVIYGLNGYKVHSKMCLITKRADSGIEYYTQIGTGNYNEKNPYLHSVGLFVRK